MAPPEARHRPIGAAVLAAIALLGLINLPQPFAWDQAMFTLGARMMQHGAVLYRDYWDPKQPGLFWFFQLGGALFGFSEVGIHALEVLVMVAFAGFLMFGLRDAFATRRGPAFAALLVVGMYFAACGDWHLTQIEGLVGLPLFAVAWSTRAAALAPHRAGRLALIAGLATGITVLLKLLFLPIAIAIAITGLAARRPAGGAADGARGFPYWRALSMALVGFAIPMLGAIAYFSAHHALALAWWTSVTYPASVLAQAHGIRIKILERSLTWFCTQFFPLIVLAVPGAWLWWRARREALALQMVAWLAMSAVVIVIQRWSYWPYQFLLFLVPLGILAAAALESLAAAFATLAPGARRIERRAVGALTLGLLFAAPLATLAGKSVRLARTGFALTPARIRAYQVRASLGNGYGQILDDVAFLREASSLTGPIWVLGNPLYYWLSGREQAIPRNGASFIESFSLEEWQRVTRDLDRARPGYIFIGRDYGDIVRAEGERSAPFFELLSRSYRPLPGRRSGAWYQRVDSATP
jgi:hypothetical protein